MIFVISTLLGAIWAAVVIACVKLDNILDEIKKYKMPENGNCLNCINQDTSVINEPCYSCITSENDYPNWESARN